jgi:hypothetical protein
MYATARARGDSVRSVCSILVVLVVLLESGSSTVVDDADAAARRVDVSSAALAVVTTPRGARLLEISSDLEDDATRLAGINMS